ncbi:MAG: TIGR02221 family CRISPR-associated protein [Thiolinea sp.]
MAKIFISFLGVGFGGDFTKAGYDQASYRFEDGSVSRPTCFAQRAIIEREGATSFDAIYLLMTPESKERHRKILVDELVSIGCNPDNQIREDDSITSNQDTGQQWAWFHALQEKISDGDQVIFDFTHGFRSVPIIFSTAISFLQKVKRFELMHAYYGYVVKEDGKIINSEIIDMAKFYRINDWADGVARLVDMADASKLAELAEEGRADGFAALNDPALTQALRELTGLIKNIDVNNVGKKADEALCLIAQKQQQCSGADAQLLKMVVEKFSNLAMKASDRYDRNYFQLQLILTGMLLKHGLNMQAFTVMRECVASIGMLGLSLSEGYTGKNLFNSEGRSKLRPRFGDVFVNLCQFEKSKWHYETEEGRESLSHDPYKLNDYDHVLKPFYERLEACGIAGQLQSFTRSMNDYRNGFDHAWTAKAQALPDISAKGGEFLSQLTETIDLLNEHKFFK